MLLLGNPLWTTAGQGSAPPPPPVDDAKPFFSGGFPASQGREHAIGDRGPTPEQTHRSRVLHGIEREVIETVAARQAAALVTDTAKQQQELAGELKLRQIEMRSEHLAALSEQRQALIDREIGERLRVMQDNQNALILLMLAAS